MAQNFRRGQRGLFCHGPLDPFSQEWFAVGFPTITYHMNLNNKLFSLNMLVILPYLINKVKEGRVKELISEQLMDPRVRVRAAFLKLLTTQQERGGQFEFIHEVNVVSWTFCHDQSEACSPLRRGQRHQDDDTTISK